MTAGMKLTTHRFAFGEVERAFRILKPLILFSRPGGRSGPGGLSGDR